MSDSDTIEIEPMSIDQFAGSIVLILGAVGSLLLVVWQSRCGIHNERFKKILKDLKRNKMIC